MAWPVSCVMEYAACVIQESVLPAGRLVFNNRDALSFGLPIRLTVTMRAKRGMRQRTRVKVRLRRMWNKKRFLSFLCLCVTQR